MKTDNYSFDPDNLDVEISDQTAVIRFNRPEIKNPLSVHTLEEIAAVFSEIESDPKIHKIIFTGSGNTFASGADLKEIAQLNEKTAREFGLRGQRLMQEIYQSEKLTIAAINGFCMGGGLDLALSCKKRIASRSAVFAHPGANLGIMTGWGGTQLLPRLIGESNALELFMTAKRVDATEALRIGLIDEATAHPLKDALKTADLK